MFVLFAPVGGYLFMEDTILPMWLEELLVILSPLIVLAGLIWLLVLIVREK
jgi:hypothetical protein